LSESYGKQTISSEYERAYKQFSQIASDYYRYDAISIPIDSNYVVNVINGYDIDVQYARYSQNITAINSLYASEVKYKGIHSSVFYELHVSSNNLGALLYIQSSSENIFAVSIDYLINKSSVLSIEQNLPELNVLSGIEVLSNYVVSSRNAVELAIVAQYDVNVVETIESDNLSVEDRRLFATAQDAIDAGIAAGYVNAKAYQLQDGVYFWYVETEDDAFCKLDIDVIRAVPVSWYVQGG
jgi:hypothetical protein